MLLMEDRITRLKMLTTSFDEKQVIDRILEVKGIINAEFSNENEEMILSYSIIPQASEYDVMVAVMNLLETEFQIENEMYFDEDSAVEVEEQEDNSYYDEQENVDFEEEIEETEEEQAEDNGVMSKNDRIFEFGQFCFSLVALIIGYFLSKTQKASRFSDYVLIVAYSISAYESVFEGVKLIIKRNYFNTKITLFVASLLTVILGDTVTATVIMLLNTVFENISAYIYNKYNLDEKKLFLAKNYFGVEDNKSTCEQKIIKFSKYYTPVLLVLTVLLIFVMPIFNDIYKVGLSIWAKRAVVILFFAKLDNLLLPLKLSLLFTKTRLEKEEISVEDNKILEEVSKVQTVIYSDKSVFLNNGSIIPESKGAVLETFDSGVKNQILLSQDNKEQTSAFRKEICLNKSVSGLSNESKIEEIKNIAENKIIVVAENEDYSNLGTTLIVGETDKTADIKAKKLSSIPTVIKLAKRTFKTIKSGLITNIIVSVVFLALSLSGIYGNLFVYGLVSGLLSLILLAISYINSLKVY